MTSVVSIAQSNFIKFMQLFVCFATKAVHIEIVPDLTTDAFISAFVRFCSRRGRPNKVFSDNGSNVEGASDILDNEKIEAYAAGQGIDWELIPACSPHFGGFWKASVNSERGC